MKVVGIQLKSLLNHFLCRQYLELWLPYLGIPEAVTQTCSVKKVSLEVPQNSKENTCAISWEFWEISKNSFFYKTPPVATSGIPIFQDTQWLFLAFIEMW